MSDVKSSRMLKVAQAAKLLGVHPNTVRNWADKGEVPTVKSSAGYRMFRMEDIEARRHRVAPQGDTSPDLPALPAHPTGQTLSAATLVPPSIDDLLDRHGFQGAVDRVIDGLNLDPGTRRRAERAAITIIAVIGDLFQPSPGASTSPDPSPPMPSPQREHPNAFAHS